MNHIVKDDIKQSAENDVDAKSFESTNGELYLEAHALQLSVAGARVSLRAVPRGPGGTHGYPRVHVLALQLRQGSGKLPPLPPFLQFQFLRSFQVLVPGMPAATSPPSRDSSRDAKEAHTMLGTDLRSSHHKYASPRNALLL